VPAVPPGQHGNQPVPPASAGGEGRAVILPCLAGKASSKVSVSRRMWKYQREFKAGPEKRPGAGKGAVQCDLEVLKLFSLLQGSTEDSFSFSCHRKPACGRGQNHATCNKLPGAGDTEHLDDELHAHLARRDQTHRVRALPPAGLVLWGCSCHWHE